MHLQIKTPKNLNIFKLLHKIYINNYSSHIIYDRKKTI